MILAYRHVKFVFLVIKSNAGRSGRPDAIAIMFYGGETWTWRQTLELTQRAAKGLQAMGVKKGDHVLSWQPNNREAILTWFGLNYLGAVYVPVNTAYKGALLHHVVQLSDATLMVCHADLAPRLNEIDTGLLRDVIITHGETSLPNLTPHPVSALISDQGLSEMPEVVEALGYAVYYLHFRHHWPLQSGAFFLSSRLFHGAGVRLLFRGKRSDFDQCAYVPCGRNHFIYRHTGQWKFLFLRHSFQNQRILADRSARMKPLRPAWWAQ